MPASLRFPLLGCLVVALIAPAASAQVKVKKEKATLQTKTFDPQNPPKEAPLNGALAITVADFKISGNMGFKSTTKKQEENGDTTASIRSASFDLKLELFITYWLPTNADEKTKIHEAGHKKMADRVYADADKVARAIAKDYLGKASTGTGGDYQKAANAALGKIMSDLGAEYLKMTSKRVQRLNDIYDELTEHGYGTMTEDDAIEASFKREAEESAARKAEEKSAGGEKKPAEKKFAPKPKAPPAVK